MRREQRGLTRRSCVLANMSMGGAGLTADAR
jgi:hypothetical protein